MRDLLRSLLAIPLGIQAWTSLPAYPTGAAYFLGNGSRMLAIDRHEIAAGLETPNRLCHLRTAANTWETTPCVETLRGTLGTVVTDGTQGGPSNIHVERVGTGIRQRLVSLPENSKILDHDEDRLLVAGGNQYLFVVKIPRDLPADSLLAREQIQVRLRSGPLDPELSQWTDVVGGRLDGPFVLVWTRFDNWMSRDSGYSWERIPLAPFREVAMDGANLVAITAIKRSIHSSRDGGATWDSGGTALASGPTGLRFLDHRLFGDFSGTEGTGGLARSDDLGRLWSVVARGASASRMASSEGALWISHEKGSSRSRDGGRTWSPADSGLPYTGDTWKVRARGSELIVQRRVSVSDLSRQVSLWRYEDGRWEWVHDTIRNFELESPAEGGRVHVITGWESDSYRLRSSSDLVTWSEPSTAKPWLPDMALDRGTVVVGQKNQASRSKPRGDWEWLPAWSTPESSLQGFGVWGSRLFWKGSGAWMESGPTGPTELFPPSWSVQKLSPLDDTAAVVLFGSTLGRIHRDDSLRFEPILDTGQWEIESHGGRVLAHRSGDAQFHWIARDSVEAIPFPTGVKPVSVWHLPARPFDRQASETDSGYLVVDEGNTLHWSGRVSTAGASPNSRRGDLQVATTGSALLLDLPSPASVAIEVFDVQGRLAVPRRILRLSSGSHRIETGAGSRCRFARVRINEGPPRIVRLPIFD